MKAAEHKKVCSHLRRWTHAKPLLFALRPIKFITLTITFIFLYLCLKRFDIIMVPAKQYPLCFNLWVGVRIMGRGCDGFLISLPLWCGWVEFAFESLKKSQLCLIFFWLSSFGLNVWVSVSQFTLHCFIMKLFKSSSSLTLPHRPLLLHLFCIR